MSNNDMKAESTSGDCQPVNPTLTELHNLNNQKLLKCSTHARLPLAIYNYTSQAQWKGDWTPTILACRGLVVDANTGHVVARPPTKFHTWGDKAALAEFADLIDQNANTKDRGRRVVFDKLDGSLMIWFNYQGEWIMASRGSFESPHAVEGQRIACENGLDKTCDPSFTYIFELIHPALMVRLHYGQRQEVVLLAMVRTATGEEQMDIASEAARLKISAVEEFTNLEETGLEELNKHDVSGREGYVVRWDDGSRGKIKFKSYHSGPRAEHQAHLRTRVVRELCFSGNVQSVIESVDDERFDEVRETERVWAPRVKAFQARLQSILDRLEEEKVPIKEVPKKLETMQQAADPPSAEDGWTMPTIRPSDACRLLALRRRPGWDSVQINDQVWRVISQLLE